jgi:hypothetical protein
MKIPKKYTADYGKDIIKKVALENKYIVGDGTKLFIVQYDDKWNAVDFRILENADGYLEVHQYEEKREEEPERYGRAVYSLRTISDVILFCELLINSVTIRARR